MLGELRRRIAGFVAPLAAALAFMLSASAWAHAPKDHSATTKIGVAVEASSHHYHHRHHHRHGPAAHPVDSIDLSDAGKGGCDHDACGKLQCCAGVLTPVVSPLSNLKTLGDAPSFTALRLPSRSLSPADHPPKRH